MSGCWRSRSENWTALRVSEYKASPSLPQLVRDLSDSKSIGAVLVVNDGRGPEYSTRCRIWYTHDAGGSAISFQIDWKRVAGHKLRAGGKPGHDMSLVRGGGLKLHYIVVTITEFQSLGNFLFFRCDARRDKFAIELQEVRR